MIVAKQVKAARVMLDLTQSDLAWGASLSIPTVQRMEASNGPVRGNSRNVWQLQKALEDAGIEFIDADKDRGPGVRLRRPDTPPKQPVPGPATARSQVPVA